MKRYDDAIKCYDVSCELDPDDSQTLNDKGIAYSESGRDEDAIKCFDESLNLDQNYVWAWVNKYLILYRLGKFDDAQECRGFSGITRLAPTSHYVRYLDK